MAAIGGNIMTGSPISDLNPILVAAGCGVRVAGLQGSRELPLDMAFFLGYRRVAVRDTEVLVSITVPFTRLVSTSTSISTHLHLRPTSTPPQERPVFHGVQAVPAKGGRYCHRQRRLQPDPGGG